MYLPTNSTRLLNYLKENNDKNLTARDVANALNMDIRTVDGLFTSAFLRQGLGTRVADGATKYLKLTPAGLAYTQE